MMPALRWTVSGHTVLVLSDSVTGRAKVVCQLEGRRVYIGDLLPQVRDVLHAHLSDPMEGIEAWEPDRPWPWRVKHKTHDKHGQALTWLVRQAKHRGTL